MEDIYWIGVFLGLGLAIGVLLAGVLGASRPGLLAAVGLAAVAGFVLGYALGGTALLVGGAALAVAAAAFIPLVGYLGTLGLPLLAARMRRRRPERYAGLRTLARD
jgi:hypothetical protein